MTVKTPPAAPGQERRAAAPAPAATAAPAPASASAPALASAPAPVGGPAFRRFMRSWATGVAVVTTVAVRPAGCTVNALMSVSLRPPLLLISLGEHSSTLAAVRASGRFAANLLAADQRRLAERFSAPRGDRFADVPYRMVHGVPVLDGAMAATVCAVDRLVPTTDHVLVLGRPLWCDVGERADPVIFFGGGYARTGYEELT